MIDTQIFIKGFKEPSEYFTNGIVLCVNPENSNYGEFRVIKKHILHKGNITEFKFYPFTDSPKITDTFKKDYKVMVFNPHQEILTQALNFKEV